MSGKDTVDSTANQEKLTSLEEYRLLGKSGLDHMQTFDEKINDKKN